MTKKRRLVDERFVGQSFVRFTFGLERVLLGAYEANSNNAFEEHHGPQRDRILRGHQPRGPDSDLVLGEIIEDDDTVRGAARSSVLKQESKSYAAQLRAEKPPMDGMHRNPFGEHDTHLTGLVAKVRFGQFVFDTSGDATEELIETTAYLLSQIYEVRGFVLEMRSDRYDLLPVDGDGPEAIKAEVEATLKRLDDDGEPVTKDH